jgi:hypothetical protein
MNSRTTEKLLQKYFEGETSLQEEDELKAFFRQDDVPPHLLSLKQLFITYSKEKEIAVLDEQFDEDLMSRIENNTVISINRRRRSRFYMISSIAAGIILIVAFSIYFNMATKAIEDSFNDPQIAYNEAKKVMLFISEKLNKGIQPVGEAAARVEKGVNELKAVEKFNTGIEETYKLEKFNRIQFLFNNAVMR